MSFDPIVVRASTPTEDDANSAPRSILPSSENACVSLDEFRKEVNNIAADEKLYTSKTPEEKSQLLTCGIRTGYMKFWMLKYYVVYVLNFLIGISGILAVLMMIVGAYYYILGGFNEDMDTGKNILKYAILGFVLVILSWSIVNGLLILITS